ncbi:MAG: YggU family protein [Gammaproteobacteria bacterium]|nr:YggU family protein [Gammaproteobacteria bacterium]
MSPPFYQWRGTTLTLNVYVQPRASRNEVIGPHNGALKIRITAPPIEGKANRHLIQFLATLFGVSKSGVALLKGNGSRVKRFEVTGPKTLPPGISSPETS